MQGNVNKNAENVSKNARNVNKIAGNVSKNARNVSKIAGNAWNVMKAELNEL